MEKTYKKKACYTLPAHIVEALKALSEKRGYNQSVIVQMALEEFLRKEGQSIGV